MFGPNTHITSQLSLEYSHRNKEFFSLYSEVSTLFESTFNLQNYRLLFIPGSGTIGIEAVIRSCSKKIEVVGHKGKFRSRWESLVDLYPNHSPEKEKMFCQLETSNSSVYERDGCIVDAVSSFPFYDLPKGTKLFVTCSNKQIGSFPGLSIVGIHNDHLDLIKNDPQFSYLNLQTYLDYSYKLQLPTTAPIQIFTHLREVLLNFNLKSLRNKIVENSFKITSVVGIGNIVGEKICPVITLPKTTVPKELASKYQLYGTNSDSDFYQLFTYSTSNQILNNFIYEFKKYR